MPVTPIPAVVLFVTRVTTMAEFYRQPAALGGSVQGPEHECEARGSRACDGVAPEGNMFQVREAIR